MTLRFGVIPTNGRDCIQRALPPLMAQADHVVVVESGPEIIERDYPSSVTVLSGGPELNISHWWNVGIDWAAEVAKKQGAETWDVAVINDDVIIPDNWFCYVADDMRALNCVAGCSGGRIGRPVIQRVDGPVDVFYRMLGFAYVLAGEYGLRADEDMKVWFGDDDLGARAAAAGGMVVFPGCNVDHLHPSEQFISQQAQIVADRTTFIRKRGYVPW